MDRFAKDQNPATPLPGTHHVDPTTRQLAQRIRRHRCFGGLRAERIAEHLAGVAFGAGFELERVCAAIDRAAGEVVAADAAGVDVPLRARAQILTRWASRPHRLPPPGETEHTQQTEEANAEAARRMGCAECKSAGSRGELIPVAGGPLRQCNNCHRFTRARRAS